MFSQRNNPYCELLKFDFAKVGIKTETTKFFPEKVAFEARKDVFSASGLLSMLKKWSAFAAEALLEKYGLSEKTLRVIPLRLKML